MKNVIDNTMILNSFSYILQIKTKEPPQSEVVSSKQNKKMGQIYFY
jgi:hypothetical protein